MFASDGLCFIGNSIYLSNFSVNNSAYIATIALNIS